MSDAELMHELFAGSDFAHGRSEMTQQITPKGKHEAKSWTEKRPVELKDWEKHLAGVAGIGIPPLNSKNEVKWGAIDVDVYNGFSIESLNALVQEKGLPLVICRSKSGGPHIFLFLKEWVPAKDMIEKLDSLAGFLGFGTSEIFPKQAMVAQGEKSQDFGSWINMPYFGGTNFLRYALDEKGQAILQISSFRDYCKGRRLTKEEFDKLTPPPTPDIFPDGPPCLNQIFASRPADMRNVLLSNAAVYAKKAFPENWKEKLDEYNRLFPEPLGSSEVEALKKSYDKKEYRYQCSKQPLCNFCDSSRCRKTKHGVGGGEFLPAARSLSMVDTAPPIWYLDVTMPDNQQVRISLSTEELQNPRLFQRRCMETIQQMPPSMKMDEWQPIVQSLMQHVTKIEVPPEMSPAGQFIELLWDFLHNRATEESFENLIRGIPFKDNTSYYFRLRDLNTYLNQQRFIELKPNQIMAIIRNTLKGVKGFKNIGGRGTNYFQLPIPSSNDSPENTQLATATFATSY